jgi:iron complex outermembrane recepter protein
VITDNRKMPQLPQSNPTLQPRRRMVAALALAQCTLFGGLLAPLAVAQEARMLEEVIVTARRKEESLQEVPIAITAFDNETLREKNITMLDDMRTQVPSLGVSVGGSSTNAPIISLRGQRPSEVLLTLDPAVPMYFAEVILAPTQGTNLSMYDLANVQVLKGPQGTLFGRNSTGGAMILTPELPGEEFSGNLELTAGDYDLFGVKGAVDIPMGNRAAMRIAGQSVERDGYQDNVANNNLAEKERYWDEDSDAIRVTLRLDLTDSLENLTTFDWNENDMQARVPTPQAFNPSSESGCRICPVTNSLFNSNANAGLIDDALARQRSRDWNEIETDVDAREKVKNTFVANTTSWEINDAVTLKNVFGYRKMEQDFHNDTDGTWLPMFGTITEGSQTTIGVTTAKSAPQSTVEADTYSNELQLLGNAFDTRLDWIVGAYYYNLDGDQSSPTQVLPIVLQNSPLGDVKNESYAVFGEGTWSFNDQWAMTLGARQTWDKREVTVKNVSRGACSVSDENGNVLPLDACSRKEDEDFDKPTWRAVGKWTPDTTSMAYASVSTGYRSGGFNLRGANNFTLTPFDEETVTSYEIGYKGGFSFGDSALLRTDFALYYQDFEDIQKTQQAVGPDGSFGTTTINAAEAEISGFEANLMFSPMFGLDFNLAYAYVDTEYNEWDVINAVSGEVEDASNRPFTWIPENSVTTSVRWELPVNEEWGFMSLNASYYWQDKVYAVDATSQYTFSGIDNGPLNDTIEQDSYGVVDVRADWNSIMQSNFDLGLWVKNAGDEEYAVGGINVLDALGWSASVFGAPRTWGASVRYNF